MKGRFANWLTAALDLICPARCLLCGEFLERNDKSLCRACLAALEPMPRAACGICGRPFTTTLESVHACGPCLKQAPPFDHGASAGLYEGRLREAVHRFKYGGVTDLAAPLGDFMADCLQDPFFPPSADVILPVPLHARRLRRRGFNQALLLTRRLYGPWMDRIQPDLLIRSRFTLPQVRLSSEVRKVNVRGAFAVRDAWKIAGRDVMVVDDVFTTGATVEECSRVLKKAGAKRVLVLTLARVR